MSKVSITVHAEALLNAKVLDQRDRAVGRIEEIIAEQHGDDLLIQEYHTGGYGMLERLSAITVGERVLRLLGRHSDGYVIKWNQLDIADPQHPRLTCPRSELERRN